MIERSSSTRTVVVIGGGVSGTLVAMGLLRAHVPLQIVVVEPRPVLGRGLAYSTRCPCHLMNVPAAMLSLVEGEPSHFARWLQLNWQATADESSFAPRSLFARYVYDLLGACMVQAEPYVALKHIRVEAVDLVRREDRWTVRFSDGSAVEAETVVLATGNPPPAANTIPAGEFRESPHYIPNAWQPGAFEGLDPESAVLLLGSGLTAVDAVLALDASGHRGNIHVISRRGLFPRYHYPLARPSAAPEFSWRPRVSPGIRDLVAQVRQQVRVNRRRRGEGPDTGWRRVIDSLRADTPALWRGLTKNEQQRFLRHVRPFWDVHRHRMAPEAAARIERLMKDGRLQILGARLQRIEPRPDGARVELRLRRNGQSAWIKAARVINCAGSETNYRKLTHPLWTNLFAGGLVDSGPLGLGLKTTDEGELIGADGQTWPELLTLGPTRIGSLWESVAVPEIRGQATALVSRLMSRLEDTAASRAVERSPSVLTHPMITVD